MATPKADPTRVGRPADALRTITYQGACEKYKADAGQGLHHASYVESFDANAKPTIVKTFVVPAPTGGG